MFYRFIVYPFVWTLLMIGLNFVRATPIPSHQIIAFLYFDKVFHFMQFCILSFLLLVAFHKQHTYMTLRLRAFKATLIYSLVLLGLISLIHLIIAKEYFEFGDILAGAVGISGGLGIFYLIYLYKNDS